MALQAPDQRSATPYDAVFEQRAAAQRRLAEVVKTVLAVDDDIDFLDLLDAVLTQEGYRFVPCVDPREAFPKARQFRPMTMIVDLLMPWLPGWQVVEQVKADPTTASSHVIVCTAALPKVAEHAALWRLWGCEVLPKPFELDELLSMLARASERSEAC